MQREYEKIEEEFEKELKALELKYHKEHFAPLYKKRADIVVGKYEPTEEESKEEDEEEEEETEPKIQEIKEEKKDEEVKEETEEEKNIVGVPEFWLTALKHHEMLDSAITEKDEEALKYLVDITQDPVEEEQGSFTLKFHFKENPYFTNEVISKTYHLEGDGEEGDEVVCESVDSTQINWKEGQDLTQGVKKGFGPEGSFFNFFAPPEVQQGKKASPKIVSMMELDFEMAVSLKEEIIKHAVHWFTGDASVDGFGGDDEDDDEDGEVRTSTFRPLAHVALTDLSSSSFSRSLAVRAMKVMRTTTRRTMRMVSSPRPRVAPSPSASSSREQLLCRPLHHFSRFCLVHLLPSLRAALKNTT
jgi:nucleosome assembly protein 1-like 1